MKHTEAPVILIVDDNDSSREILASIIESAGWTVVEAADGDTAIEMVRASRPNLILLDVMMPGKSGYEVCEDLKRDDKNADLPIIFLSALSGATDKVEGLRRGAVDYVSKPFDAGEVMARVEGQLRIQRLSREVFEANEELRSKQARLEEDLKAAEVIQRTLIPQRAPSVAEVGLAWRFLPCEHVGGDVFQVYRLDESHLGLYVADVSGHGVPGAMVTVSLSQTLTPGGDVLLERAEDGGGRVRGPAEVMRLLDLEYPLDRFERHFTISYVLLDRTTRRLRYSRAGHPPPLRVSSSGRIDSLEEGGTIIGMGDVLPFEEGEVTLAPGDRIFLYTDGVAEFTNSQGVSFGMERLRNLLSSTRDVPLDDACQAVIDALRRFGEGIPFQDDVTLVGLEILPD
jgi:sigma-B regulation protein RsbU (phosphoserine phosphatase)